MSANLSRSNSSFSSQALSVELSGSSWSSPFLMKICSKKILRGSCPRSFFTFRGVFCRSPTYYGAMLALTEMPSLPMPGMRNCLRGVLKTKAPCRGKYSSNQCAICFSRIPKMSQTQIKHHKIAKLGQRVLKVARKVRIPMRQTAPRRKLKTKNFQDITCLPSPNDKGVGQLEQLKLPTTPSTTMSNQHLPK